MGYVFKSFETYLAFDMKQRQSVASIFFFQMLSNTKGCFLKHFQTFKGVFTNDLHKMMFVILVIVDPKQHETL